MFLKRQSRSYYSTLNRAKPECYTVVTTSLSGFTIRWIYFICCIIFCMLLTWLWRQDSICWRSTHHWTTRCRCTLTIVTRTTPSTPVCIWMSTWRTYTVTERFCSIFNWISLLLSCTAEQWTGLRPGIVSQKTRPLRLIWHNFINSQHLLIIFGRDRPHLYLNWQR